MAPGNEVEIKFLVDDVDALSCKLIQLGFTLQTKRTHELNTLYDTPDQSLKNLGQLLRIRKYGEKWVLTHKQKTSLLPTRHKSRVETETEVSDGEQLDHIIRALGFQPSFTYEKFRAEWTDGSGHVVVDETPIGNVAEIEGPSEWIDRTAQALGIPEDRYVTKNYATLFEEWRTRTGSTAENMTFREVGSNKAQLR